MPAAKTITKHKEKSAATSYNAPAIDKALDVLELLADSSQGMSLTGIADALGRTKQELFRVLVCLFERGYLVRDENQIYRLSTKLFEIGSQHASTQTLIARATSHMERLVVLLGESCHLNVVVQNHMLVIAKVEAQDDVMLTVRVGATFALHQRNSGLVGLAFQTEECRQRYWKQSGESVATIGKLEKQIQQIVRQGYLKAPSPLVQGVYDTAVPITGSQQKLLGVLAVPHIRRVGETGDREELLVAVRDCARAISAEFGPVSA